jgi:hypothetical protein
VKGKFCELNIKMMVDDDGFTLVQSRRRIRARNNASSNDAFKGKGPGFSMETIVKYLQYDRYN